MANSTTHLDTVVQSQASKEVTINAYFDASSLATLYGRRASTTVGLTWGYYGGNASLSTGVLSQVANGTIGLTASSTNYIVSLKSTGAITASVVTTNWNDTSNYWRIYSVVTGATTITSYTDYREIGKLTGIGTGLVAPIIKTTTFTLGSHENNVICNGTATITVTLPSASSWIGRVVSIKNIAAFSVISASSNVVPINSTATGTIIISGIIGRWVNLVSDGTNWVTMSQGTENYEFTAPVTKTTAFTITAENDIICNGTATMAATLPAAATYPGRSIRFKNRAAFTITSASSNIKPIDTDTAGTAILPAIIGSWAILTSDGTNWVIMSQGLSDTEFTPPVSKTTDFTVGSTDNFIKCNGTATITVTLPAAATYPGRRIVLKTIAAFTVISASSNVLPIDSDTAGTSILAGTVGKWAKLVSDGTNWIIMMSN